MLYLHMSTKDSTVEKLIEGLDQRGLLVFLVLLGQQSMKILAEDHAKHAKAILPNRILTPNL